MTQEREQMTFDVLIVGAGISGLASAIRIKQLAHENNQDISVCIVEKGSEVGAHILSGAVMDPIALNELLPDWRRLEAPLSCAVEEDRVYFLTKNKAFKLPTPPSFHNQGNYIVSLGKVCRFLADYAQNLGVEIYPGFAAAEVLYDQNNRVIGIATGDMGVDKEGKPTDNYQQGMELLAQQTIFAEGCRGSLSQLIIKKFALDKNAQTQTYGIGIKEVWEVPAEQCQKGLVIHTTGWPLDSKTYGGSFVYHGEDNQIALGIVVGLDYQNPYLSPFEEMQRFKTHPLIRPMLKGGRRIAYGARALVEGGLQSLPQLSFEGGVLVGDAAGFLNMPRIKGSHTALKSGILAAEAVFDALQNHKTEAVTYAEQFKKSWLFDELHQARNIRPSFRWGLWPAMIYTALEQYIFKGKTPWTLAHHGRDDDSLKNANDCPQIDYPKPDGTLTFDRLSSVFLANVAHEENQICHLQLSTEKQAENPQDDPYQNPEVRFCPAGVYEIIEENGNQRLQINAQNCLHCKSCDIKVKGITWTCPEGGGGPNYGAM